MATTRNKVQVTLEGKDELSGVLNRITGRGGLFGRAMEFGLDLARRAAEGFGNALQRATDSQTNLIKSVGGLAAAIGMPFEQAEQLNTRITEGLAEYAAALPGTTDDYVKLYRAISDDVALANKELNNGRFDAESYTDQVTSLAAKFQALGDGLTFAQVLNPLQKILAGGSLSQLQRLKFFQSNPLLLNKLEEVLGNRELGQLTSGERMQVAIQALDLTLTDDTIARLAGTVDGQVQTLMTKLFDPTVGVFGLMRDLDEQASGQQTAFAAINELVVATIGENGLLYNFADMLKALGVEFADPMASLRSGVLFLKGKIEFISAVIRRFGAIFEVNEGFAMNYLRNQISYFLSRFKLSSLGEWLSERFNLALQLASKIDYKMLFGAAGKLLANLINEGTDFLKGLDWGMIAKSALNLLGGLIIGLGSFLTNLDFESYTLIAALIGGSAIAALIGTAITTAAGLFGTSLLFAVSYLSPGLITAFAGAVSGVPLILAAGAVFAIAALAKAIIDNWDALWGGIKSSLDAVGDTIAGIFTMLAGVAVGNGDIVKMGAETFFQGIRGIFDWLNSRLDDVKAQFGFQTSGQARAEDTAMLAEQRFQAANNAAPASTVTPTVPTPATTSSTPVPRAASGFLPATGLGGLLSAAIAESRQMPSGAGLMVANSSEAILNRAQQAAIASAMGNSGRSRGGTFAPQISVQAMPGMDINALASEVMRRMNEAFGEYEAGFLT